MTCVIFVSTTDAEAPRYTVSMLTIGGWTFGVSRTDRRPARHQADDREQQAQDHREDGPADGDVGEDHVDVAVRAAVGGERVAPCTRTGTPSRRFSVPSMTTPSSALRPCRIFDFARAGAGRS